MVTCSVVVDTVRRGSSVTYRFLMTSSTSAIVVEGDNPGLPEISEYGSMESLVDVQTADTKADQQDSKTASSNHVRISQQSNPPATDRLILEVNTKMAAFENIAKTP